jgi:RHS repeat-associated protein
MVANAAGQTVWKWDQQEPFGANLADEDPDANSVAFELPFRFPGQYADKETNLFYNYFRDYDPSFGRYVESDPIGLKGGINTYLYVEATPLLQIDMLGLANGPALKQMGIPQSFGFSKGKCSYYEEKCKQSGLCTPRDEYACNARKCCESFDDSSYSNRCTRECLIQYDISNCTGQTGAALNNCRRVAHVVCYTRCLNVVEAARSGVGFFPPKACKAAAGAMGGMW